MLEFKKKENIYKHNTGNEFDKRSKIDIYSELKTHDEKL